MINRRLIYVSLVALALLLYGMFVYSTAHGQAESDGALSATPSKITVTAQQGAIETRQIVLRATQPITDLLFIVSDLERADGSGVLPSQHILIASPSLSIAANDVLTTPIKIDLAGAHSGEFSGELIIRHNGDLLHIPLVVKVRDPIWFPCFVLLTGIGLGLFLSKYRAQSKIRDELLLRASQIEAHLRTEGQLLQSFRNAIDRQLSFFDAALRDERWETSGNAVSAAEQIRDRWYAYREDWEKLDNYAREIDQQTCTASWIRRDSPYIQHVRANLENIRQALPEEQSPEKARERLAHTHQQARAYQDFDTTIRTLYDKGNELTVDEVRESWQERLLARNRELDSLDPEDSSALASLKTNLERDKVDLQEQLAGQGLTAIRSRGDAGVDTSATDFPRPPLAYSRSSQVSREVRGARWRLASFWFASYIITILLLAFAGFAQLYAANQTFGANPWIEYPALFAWGFGAEMTRAAVADLARGWGIQEAKSE